jgi:hypothetical protein
LLTFVNKRWNHIWKPKSAKASLHQPPVHFKNNLIQLPCLNNLQKPLSHNQWSSMFSTTPELPVCYAFTSLTNVLKICQFFRDAWIVSYKELTVLRSLWSSFISRQTSTPLNPQDVHDNVCTQLLAHPP